MLCSQKDSGDIMTILFLLLKWYGLFMAVCMVVLILSAIINIGRPSQPISDEEYNAFMESMKSWKKKKSL